MSDPMAAQQSRMPTDTVAERLREVRAALASPNTPESLKRLLRLQAEQLTHVMEVDDVR